MVYGERPLAPAEGEEPTHPIGWFRRIHATTAVRTLPRSSHQPGSNRPPVADYVQGGRRLPQSPLLPPFRSSSSSIRFLFHDDGRRRRSSARTTMDRNRMPRLSPISSALLAESISVWNLFLFCVAGDSVNSIVAVCNIITRNESWMHTHA